jgi:protocatechuate 3,4-dioxygenase beta subunit
MNTHEEHDDDRPVGRLLTRREVLGLLAGAGAALLAGCDLTGRTPPPATPTTTGAGQPAATPTPAAPTPATVAGAPTAAATPAAAAPTTGTLPSCVVRPEMTEGPYFVDEMLDRSDIRPDPATGTVSEGVPLALTFLVSQVGAGATCAPLAGAQVDVWHCDALGVYSDVQGSVGTKFLRGYQVTDAAGRAAFTTIYPGWYRGRATHIHFKIRTGAGYEFTSQLFFDDTLSQQVHTQGVYAAKGVSTTPNSRDGIYRTGGDQLLLKLSEDGQGGYRATFDIGLQIA